MKKVYFLFLFILIFTFNSCSINGFNEDIDASDEIKDDDSPTAYEYLVTKATNDNGNCFEIYLCIDAGDNNWENRPKIGIKMDGEWSLEPTDQMPFIDKMGIKRGGAYLKDNAIDKNNIFLSRWCNNIFYVGNDCFLCLKEQMTSTKKYTSACYYNVRNNKYYNTKQPYLGRNEEFATIENNEKIRIVSREINQNYTTFTLLDTDNMTTKFVTVQGEAECYTMSENLFGVVVCENEQKYDTELFGVNGKLYFYNSNGERIIDLSMYNFSSFNNIDYDIVFKNGICTLVLGDFTIDDKDSLVEVTIDKNGKIISK